MRNSRKFLALVLAVILCAGILPLSALATGNTKYLVYVTPFPQDGSGGTIQGEGDYLPGQEVTISVIPDKAAGYCSAQWLSPDLGMSLIPANQQKFSHTFTMPEKNVELSISFAPHEFGIAYQDLGNGTHDSYCLYCQERQGTPAAHVDADGNERCDDCSYDWHSHSLSATYQSDDTAHWRSCAVCKDEYAQWEEHTYSQQWLFDATGHFHGCVCGRQQDFASHVSSGPATVDQAEKCTLCGYEIAPKRSGYTVTLTANGGTGEDVILEMLPGTYDLPECPFTAPEGLLFRNWSASANGPYLNSLEVTQDITLYALWSRPITVSFDPNGGSGTTDSFVVPQGTLFYLPSCEFTPPYEDFAFRGWRTIADSPAAENIRPAGHEVYMGSALDDHLIYVAEWTWQATPGNPNLSGDGVVTWDALPGATEYILSLYDSRAPHHTPYTYTVAAPATSFALGSAHTSLGGDFHCTIVAKKDGTASNAATTETVYLRWTEEDNPYLHPAPAPGPLVAITGYPGTAYLKGHTVILGSDSTPEKELDISGLDADTLQLPGDTVDRLSDSADRISLVFPGDVLASISSPGWDAIGGQLDQGDSLQIQTLPIAPVAGIAGQQLGGVEINLSAQSADGTLRPITVTADSDDAFGWSINLRLEEGMSPSHVAAYRINDDNSLTPKSIRYQEQDAGCVLFTAYSKGNSRYIFLYEPPAAQPKAPSTGLIVALMIAAVALLGGSAWLISKKKK